MARLRILSRLSLTSRVTRALATVVVLVSTTTAAAASSTFASVATRCTPASLNASAALAGGDVTVSPAPGTRDAFFLTQISFLGTPASDIAGVGVTGSRSGHHTGHLLGYSQGDGASFLPSKPFTPGELVTVHASLRRAGITTPFAWHFIIAEPDTVSRSLETPPAPPPPPKASEFQRFVSRSDLRPPTVTVTTNVSAQTPGDIFLAPYAGPGQYGPMILDGTGKLLWFKAIPSGSRAADLRVQQYEGRSVLTWWQDPLVASGKRNAGIVIADSSYKDLAIVRAGNGYQPDLHAFEITPRGTALFTVYDAVRCNLSAYAGPADGAVADTLVQELDLKTGLVRFEWHSLDHVALSDSHMPVGHGGTPTSPWDWFHINAVSEPGGDLLIDSRNTWAAYDVDHRDGQIVWTLGGKHSSFAMGPGASPAWQHDVREQPDGTISFFDNGATPRVHPQSRVIVLSLNTARKTASLLSGFDHSTALIAPSQGDFQPLPGGNWFVGWGQEPYFSEFAPAGQLLFDAHLPATYQSYTALKFPWSGAPTRPPQLTVRSSPHKSPVAYASWNGSTAVAEWQLLGGSSSHTLAPIATAARSDFETAIAIPTTAPRYLAVRALDAQGQVLGTSAIIHP